VSWLRWTVAGQSPRRPEFGRRLVDVDFVMDKVKLERFFFEYFGYHLSVSFHQCFMFIHSFIPDVI
jgi:hypothetical protein